MLEDRGHILCPVNLTAFVAVTRFQDPDHRGTGFVSQFRRGRHDRDDVEGILAANQPPGCLEWQIGKKGHLHAVDLFHVRAHQAAHLGGDRLADTHDCHLQLAALVVDCQDFTHGVDAAKQLFCTGPVDEDRRPAIGVLHLGKQPASQDINAGKAIVGFINTGQHDPAFLIFAGRGGQGLQGRRQVFDRRHPAANRLDVFLGYVVIILGFR